VVNFSAGTEAWSEFYHNMEISSVLGARMAEKLGIASPEDKEVMDRVLIEMQQEEFCGIWWFISTWGVAP